MATTASMSTFSPKYVRRVKFYWEGFVRHHPVARGATNFVGFVSNVVVVMVRFDFLLHDWPLPRLHAFLEIHLGAGVV